MLLSKIQVAVVFCFILIVQHFVCWSQSASDTTFLRILKKRANELQSTYPDSLLFYATNGLALAEKIEDRTGIADMHLILGMYNWIKGNYAESIEHYNYAIPIYTDLRNTRGQAISQSNLGMVYAKLGNYPRALDYYQKALRISKSHPNETFVGSTYNSIGVAYRNNNHYPEAIDAYEKAISIFRAGENFSQMAGSYTNLGNIYFTMGDIQKALQHHRQALQIFDSLKIFRGQVTCYNNLSYVLVSQGDFENAKMYSENALSLSRQHGFPSNEVQALAGLAEVERRQNHFQKSLLYLNEALAIAESRKFNKELIELYKGLSSVYREMNKADQALVYFEKYSVLKDSIFNIESSNSVANLRASLELEKKEKEINILKTDQQIRQIYLISLFSASVFILVIVFLLINRQRMKAIKDKELESKEILLRAEKEAARQSRKISELEIMTLRSQINPHFIFNALNSIQENILANRHHQAIQYLGNFSGLLRKTLENADKKFISLSDEINALELYLKIESSRFGFTWTIVIDPALDVFSVEVPPMIVQPFVENAIWHGLMHKSEPGVLKVEFTRNEAQLICIVEDNGVGRGFMNGKQNPLKKDYKSKGNALVSGRLEALNSLHKLNARLDIKDLVDYEGNACGTRVEVSMDLLAG